VSASGRRLSTLGRNPARCGVSTRRRGVYACGRQIDGENAGRGIRTIRREPRQDWICVNVPERIAPTMPHRISALPWLAVSSRVVLRAWYSLAPCMVDAILVPRIRLPGSSGDPELRAMSITLGLDRHQGALLSLSTAAGAGYGRSWLFESTSSLSSGAAGALPGRIGCAGERATCAGGAHDMRFPFASCPPRGAPSSGGLWTPNARRIRPSSRYALLRPACCTRSTAPRLISRARWVWTARRESPVSRHSRSIDGQQRPPKSAREARA